MHRVECDIDPARNLAIFRCIGDVPGPVLRDRIIALWTEQPRILTMDSLIDVREYVGNLSYVDIKAIALAWQSFARGGDRGRRTAVVSHDRFAGLLLKVVALLFDTRRFALFGEIQDALDWLAGAPPLQPA